ncbi:hypothetical protein [Agromyces humi]|uniref:hypothetical protein n=1 Tax=Agromyces humi TaxID=1766800 RepID=UPI0013570409|nr:hypothetical protein [Agromyces humi]
MDAATRRRTAALFAIAAAAAVTLAGCTAPTPEPTPTPEPVVDTPAPTPTAEPEPVDPLTNVTGIVVRPEYLEFRDAGGLLVSTLSYDAEAAEFIGTLSAVLGAAPDGETTSEGGMESWPTTEYWWGNGVRVFDEHEAEGISLDMNVNILFNDPVVGDGVTVQTITGFQPGDDGQSLAAELGEPWYGNGYDQVRAETGPILGEGSLDGYENAYSVAINTWDYYSENDAIFAPWNFGIGHV